MKKIFRASQKKDVLGRWVGGLGLSKYGIPYDGASGSFYPRDQERMDIMFALVEAHPELHITSWMNDGRILNRYEAGPEASFYLIYTGNKDPEIEFSNEFDLNDFTEEERRKSREFHERFVNNPPTIEQVAAVNWVIDHAKKSKRSTNKS